MRNLIALFTLTSAAIAQEARIVGPTESDPGDLIILDAKSSDGSGYAWTLANSDKTYLVFEEGSKLVFASGAPGKYVFILGVTAEGRVSIAKHTLTIRGTAPVVPEPDKPEPKPDPVIPPPPVVPDLTGLQKQAYDAIKASTVKAGEVATMASHFETVASKAGALSWTLPQLQAELGKHAFQNDTDWQKRWLPVRALLASSGPTWTTREQAAEGLQDMAAGLRASLPVGVSGDLPNESLMDSMRAIEGKLKRVDSKIGDVPL